MKILFIGGSQDGKHINVPDEWEDFGSPETEYYRKHKFCVQGTTISFYALEPMTLSDAIIRMTHQYRGRGK